MVINAAYFAKLEGTVFVVVFTKNPQGVGRVPMAQAVFKGKAAADKYAARMEGLGEVRVGHFINDTTIETI